MAAETRNSAKITAGATSLGVGQQMDKRPKSIFELPGDFFDSCRLILPGKTLISMHQFQPPVLTTSTYDVEETLASNRREKSEEVNTRLTCNTCKAEFESLVEQRSHFKSDLHRFNVKLILAGKDIMKEEDFNELTYDSFSKDFDVSSISGSEDEDERGSHVGNTLNEASIQNIKQKIFVSLLSEERVSLWKCLLLKDSHTVCHENDMFAVIDNNESIPCLKEGDVIDKLKGLVKEPRDNTNLRIMLLSRGGHFAGCVFDGSTIVAHKTFHRYVVRAKAGKKQSSKDGGGRSIHSAGASLRRYNELAMKKDIQELLASWRPYFDSSSCVFIHAPSDNRHLFYNGDKPIFSDQCCDVRNIPFTVRRPTLKEARRIYGLLSQVYFEAIEEVPDIKNLELNESSVTEIKPAAESTVDEVRISKGDEAGQGATLNDEQSMSHDSDEEGVHVTTPLHEAARCGDAEKVLGLLEQGLDPTAKDERGKTPYTLANEKEVRNTFRRFMAVNMEKWDWHAANVPSALTKEMEESQAAKQAEKDAKRKAKAKELKRLRREREKAAQAQAEATKANNVTAASDKKSEPSQSGTSARLSKAEELKKKQDEEREKRAAAAERRLAMAGAATLRTNTSSAAPTTSQQPNSGTGITTDIICSCCNASLAGKVPFHRYDYKYCSTTCMRVHKQVLEDG